MFKLIKLVLVFWSSGVLSSDSGVPDYPVDQLTPNTYVIHGPITMPSVENRGFMNNPGWVVTREGVVLVDPGSSVHAGEMVLRMIRTTSDKPVVAVLNTHVHGDHWLGNQAIKTAYPEVKIYGHPRLLEQVEAGAGESWIEIMVNLTDGATKGTKVVAAEHALKNGDEIIVGAHHFRIHDYDKAHTDTDILIEVVEESVVFLGDTVLSGRVSRFDSSSDILGNIKACTEIVKLEAKHYVPGHGQTRGREVVDAQLEYLQTLYDGVKSMYDEGLSDFEMKDTLAKSLHKYSNWLEFDAQLGKHISTTYLQIEAAEF